MTLAAFIVFVIMFARGARVVTCLTSTSSSSTSTDSELTGGRVVGLYRYPVKGLSGDDLSNVIHNGSGDGGVVLEVGETFPDDRRYALLRQPKIKDSKTETGDFIDTTKNSKFDPTVPVWLHKENFLCAFSDPEFMAQFQSSYCHRTKKLDLCRRRTHNYLRFGNDEDSVDELNDENSNLLLKSVDLSTESGRQTLADFFMKERRKKNEIEDDKKIDDIEELVCVTASSSSSPSRDEHSHQFGNTSSGWKRNKDTRTVHIINAATVRQISDVIGIPINPTRFRPNIIVDGLEPWVEFDQWVGPASASSSTSSRSSQTTKERSSEVVIQCGGVQFAIISRTVRCQGVSVDPMEVSYDRNVLDIPHLLTKHFPQYGPYLGVYAQVVGRGRIAVGDQISYIQDQSIVQR